VSPLVVAAALVTGALGAIVRYGVSRTVEARSGTARLPRAVLIVNAAGSLVAGAAIGATHGSAPELTFVLVSGFAAGLTTFSTWTVETMQLVGGAKPAAAVRHVVANLLAGGVAVWAGALGAIGIVSLVAG
jgi:CrcB protein